MSEINYQALREAAERAIPAMERLLMLPADDDLLSEQELKDYGVDIDALNAFKFLTGPETVLALLDERERNQQYIKRRDQENEEIALTVGKLRVELEEVKQHAEELSETKAVRNQWRPDICPITGRAFFMWIEHPTLGNVPTYGGPLDSYTIPTKDGDGEFSCERYDHDFGGWVESECLGLYLIDDREQCRVYELEERVKELDAREISLPERSSMLHRTDFHDDYQTVMAYKVSEVIAAIRAAMLRGAEHVSNRDELPLGYLQGHKDGLEWAAQLAEANHPQTGDWLYDDPLELAKAIRKGPDMPEFDGPTPGTPDGWISCSERMPEIRQTVIGWNGYAVRQCVYTRNGYAKTQKGREPRFETLTGIWHGVTHWMPLPEPPQEVK
ncbi:TPA: DUF551 domain-containing protein [Escherichia coli]|nr:DUF551 domain-containing protein [Escherichia coli]